MNFIYEGMSPEELAAKRAELESELMAAQFEHEFESVQMMHELRLKDIEKQIILENCSIEKIADLYANEEDLYTEAEEGLVNKFFNWLLNIVKAIFGVTKSITVDPAEKDETIELGVDVKALNAGSKSILQNLRDLTKIRDENGKLNFGAIVIDSVAAIGAVKGIGAFVSAVKKKTKLTKGEAKSEADQLAKASNDITAELKRINDSIKEEGEKNSVANSGIRSLITTIDAAVNEIKEKIGMPESSEKKSDNAADAGDNGESNDQNNGKNGGNNEKNEADGSNKDDGKSGKGSNEPAANGDGGKKYNKNDIGYVTFAADKTLSDKQRQQAVIDKMKKDAMINERNQSLCSAADHKKYVLGRIDTLKSWLDNKADYDEKDHRVIRNIIGIIEGMHIENKPAPDDSAGVIEFAMNKGKGSWSDIAHANLAAQVGYDPATKTVTCDQKTLDKYKAYYENLLKSGQYPQNSPPYNACDSALQKLKQVKIAKETDAAGNNKNGAESEYEKEVKKRLKIAYDKSVNNYFITVTKESYRRYRDELEAIIRDRDNAKSNVAKKKLAIVDKYVSLTGKAEDVMNRKNASGKGTHIDLPIWAMSGDDVKSVDSNTRRDFKVKEQGDTFVSDLTKDQFEAKLDELKNERDSKADGSEAKASLSRKYNQANTYYGYIYGGTTGNVKQAAKDLDAAAARGKHDAEAKQQANLTDDEKDKLARQNKINSSHTATDSEIGNLMTKLFGVTKNGGQYEFPSTSDNTAYMMGMNAYKTLNDTVNRGILSQADFDRYSSETNKLAKDRIESHNDFLKMRAILDGLKGELSKIDTSGMATKAKDFHYTPKEITNSDGKKVKESLGDAIDRRLMAIPEYEKYKKNIVDRDKNAA